MTRVKFANILLERNDRSIQYPSLFCKSTSYVSNNNSEQAWELTDRGLFDFTTYFNSLSVMKLKRYTMSERFFLHLELKGAACQVGLTFADALASHPSNLGEPVSVNPSESYKLIDLEIKPNDETVLTGFYIKTEGSVFIKNSYYEIEIGQSPNDIELALATTTFKKESYIINNINVIKENILNSSDDISSHFSMHIIDNGRTLDIEKLQCPHITISPNQNVGGAGGFTRGMIESMEQTPKATHILLMDDDVSVSPESIKRTYNLLRLLKNEYRDAFISGAMLNYDISDEQWEDTGYMTPQGTFSPVKPALRLTKFEDIVFNELFHLPRSIRELNQQYAAWWYCCIPITTIERNGLPLPVFVRCDDAEYGVRCKPEYISMNGICIWHESFHNRYNAAVERYQTTRNTLIAKATTGFAPNSDFLAELHNNVRLELKKYGYSNAKLVLDAFEDFMKGPDFISTPGIAEQTFLAANKNKEKLYPLSEVEQQAHELGLTDFSISNINRQLIDGDKPRSLASRLYDYATNNGQRIIVNNGQGYAVIPNTGWNYPAGAIHGKRYLIVIDWYNRVGAVREKDPHQYKEIIKRYRKDMKRYNKEISDLTKAYAAQRSRLTSLEFWKHYLGMN